MLKKLILLMLVSTLLVSCWAEKMEEKVENIVEQEVVVNEKVATETPVEDIVVVEEIATEEVVVETPAEEIVEAKTYSMKKVASYATAEKCRTIVEEKVYDITSFFGKHEGWDEALLVLCWVDGTDAFLAQHWSSEEALKMLEGMYKWKLEK